MKKEKLIIKIQQTVWGFLRARKKFWLLPLIVILLTFGVLIVLTAGSAIAPFIYTLF
jgi:hypothetical protein